MMRHRWFLASTVLLLFTQAVRAGDRPLFAPTRTAAVTYELLGSSQRQGARKMQVTYGSDGRVRMDFFRFPQANSPFAWLIYDPPSDRITTVLPERRGYVQRDIANLPSPGAFINAKMEFARLGEATIAGLQCTDWRVVNGSDAEASACITDDGVVLRATRTKPTAGTIEALSVQYETPSPDLFTAPASFEFIRSPDFPQMTPPGSAP
jgi:hypothetical protein